MTEVMRLAGATLYLRSDGGTFTAYEGPEPVIAYAEDNEEYRARAREMGYGEDVNAMSREHEIVHHLLAEWLGLPFSPTMLRLAAGLDDPMGWAEETAVMAIQRLARVRGVSLIELARRLQSR